MVAEQSDENYLIARPVDWDERLNEYRKLLEEVYAEEQPVEVAQKQIHEGYERLNRDGMFGWEEALQLEKEVLLSRLVKMEAEKSDMLLLVEEMAQQRKVSQAEIGLLRSDNPNIFVNSLGMSFVFIPAGMFMMGDSESEGDSTLPRLHQITLTNAFYIQTTPVTQGQWETIMGNNPSFFKGDKNLPVEQVSWEDCQEYINKLNNKVAETYRLPTEEEWEYCCRAGSTTPYYFGDDTSCLGEYAWYYDNSDGKTHPVYQKKPNAWGLYDMHGNVCEWCQNLYIEDSYFNSYPCLRGGSWSFDARGCRSGHRSLRNKSDINSRIGFRLLKSALY